MPTRNVVLTAHHEQVIDNLVSSGRYQNASEVLRDGLRLIEQREIEIQARLSALRDAANLGLAAIARGEYRTFTSADDIEDHLNKVAERAIAAEEK